MENVRLILIVLLSFVSLLLWEAWQRDYGQDAPPPAQSESAPPASAQDVPPPPPAPDKPPVPAPALPSAAASETRPASRIRVRTDLFELSVNPQGGVIERAALLAYPLSLDGPPEPFALLDNTPQRFFVLQGGLKAEDESPDHYASYQSAADHYEMADGANELKLDLRWRSSSGIAVLKQYVFKRGSYEIAIRYEIHNESAAPWTAHHYDQLQREQEPSRRRIVQTFTGAAFSSPEQRYSKFSFDELAEEPIEQDVTNGWVAILEHYFVSALIPPADHPYHYYSTIVEGKRYIVGFYGPSLTVAPGATAAVSTRIYVGPKLQDLLPGVAPGLELTVDYGVLWFIAKILFWTLEQIHAVCGNWGWGIILLTLIVKLLFYPLSAAGYRSMAKMRRVQPRLLALRDRYTSDRARLNQAMMELYKTEKINPLGGCFPILIQIPVFIALYWVLLESVELRQAPWILWIKDLSVKDPYFVLPVLMTISMWLQTRLNPAPLDPMQAKVMQIMPFAFGIFFAFFPSGLVLYWFVNNVLSIAQQWMITRAIEQEHPAH